MAAKLFGIMMINVQSIELSIVNLRTLRQVERVRSDVSLGEDIYDQHTIDYDSVEQAAQALSGFVQIMNDYGVKDYHLWGRGPCHPLTMPTIFKTNYLSGLGSRSTGYLVVRKPTCVQSQLRYTFHDSSK
ncbi:hypothetical protein TUA1478L_03280 [Lactiplantibacillus plantarum]